MRCKKCKEHMEPDYQEFHGDNLHPQVEYCCDNCGLSVSCFFDIDCENPDMKIWSDEE